MTKKPYMPFFPDAHMNDTVHITMEEQGAYFRLLCWMWTNEGKLLNDDQLISKILRIHPNKWQKLRPTVVSYFIPYGPDHYTQKRLLREYQRGSKSKPKAFPDTLGVKDNNALKLQYMGHEIGAIKVGDDNASTGQEFNGVPTTHPNPSSKTNRINKEEIEKAQSCGQSIETLLPPSDSLPFVNELFNHFTKRNLPMPIDFNVLANWVRKGADPQRDILPAVDNILSEVIRKGYSSPESWRYFGKAVFESLRKRKETIERLSGAIDAYRASQQEVSQQEEEESV